MRKLILSLLILFPSLALAQLPQPMEIPITQPGSFSQPPIGYQIGAQELQGLVNADCRAARIIASCASTFCADCVILEYWEPIHVVTLVKRPGDRLISQQAVVDLGGDGVFPAGNRPLGGGGGDNSTPSGNTNLHYFESRQYTIPQPFTIGCQLCGRPEVLMTVNYISDNDSHWITAEQTQFRLDLGDIIPHGLGLLGVWQERVTPLGGYSVHSSQTVAAAVTAARTIIVSSTVGVPPRNVNIPGEPALECFQPGWPIKMPCMRVGFPPPLWDFSHISPEGKYLFFFWARRECCMPVDETVCALAASGQGQNFCDIPPIPAAAGLAATIAIFEGIRGE